MRNSIAAAVRMGAACVNDVNLVHATECDAMALGRSRAIAVLSPRISFQRENGHCGSARTLIDRGAAVALGSGQGANAPNIQMTIALACGAMNMTPAEAISAATINGAHALRREETLGSLEAGKSADLVILAVPDYRELPCHFGVNLAQLVMIRGMVLVERAEVKWPSDTPALE